MAKGKVKTEKVIILELTTDEAHWLKAAVQNPFLEDENQEDENMRQNIFNSIPSFESLIDDEWK